jgi:hypothetical protein
VRDAHVVLADDQADRQGDDQTRAHSSRSAWSGWPESWK